MAVAKHDPLAVLFGSPARVKLLRLFAFNSERGFGIEEVMRRARLVRRTARTELSALERAGLIRKARVSDTQENGRKRMVQGYILKKDFVHLAALQTFLFSTAPIDHATLLSYVRKAGTFDLVVASGVFAGEFDRRIDILLVAKKVTPQKAEQAIRSLEAELGLELRYAFLPTDEFGYRFGMRDRLVRDVFDYTYQILLDRISVRDQLMRG